MSRRRMWVVAPAVAVAMALGGPAGAAPSDYVGTTTTVCAAPCEEVLGTDVGTGVADPGGRVGGRGAVGGLPVTGGDVVGLAVAGLGLLALGSVLVRGSRRRTA